ncbi:hypothetical protein FA95DRAFT_1647856 [Auriscalpium vulgare]|uniref:Uncharacterized protein n=1 Tax=Auriscalpium vulgare TaxID=40419 RepID=A0ACB8RA37_9AGAM|nr:hypothetical protein FA95DRAFT_1647856 [Auriscalpium vulgare]
MSLMDYLLDFFEYVAYPPVLQLQRHFFPSSFNNDEVDDEDHQFTMQHHFYPFSFDNYEVDDEDHQFTDQGHNDYRENSGSGDYSNVYSFLSSTPVLPLSGSASIFTSSSKLTPTHVL